MGVALVGCGFQASSAQVDAGSVDSLASTRDAAPDAAPDSGAPMTFTCMQRWMMGKVDFVLPTAFAKQSASNAAERDPWVSSDGKRLYYAYDVNSSGKSDIYVASRSATTEAFGDGTRLINLNTDPASEDRPTLTDDEKALVLASDRVAGTAKIFYVERNNTGEDFASADQRHVGNVDAYNGDIYDPFLSADGLRLYLAPAPLGQRQRLGLATRTTASGDFSMISELKNVNGGTSIDADPALSSDELVLLFSSTRSTGPGGPALSNLWYATRAKLSDDFGAPKLIPGVNGNDEDGDPQLSADGCTLYFASTRGAGKTYDLFSSAMRPN